MACMIVHAGHPSRREIGRTNRKVTSIFMRNVKTFFTEKTAPGNKKGSLWRSHVIVGTPAYLLHHEEVNDSCQCDPIQSKRNQLDFVNQLQEKANRQEGKDECADKADDKEGQGLDGDVLPVLQ